MTDIRPLHDLVLIEPKPLELKSPGGIIIPESAAEKQYEGTVLAVGPGSFVAHQEINEIGIVTTKPLHRPMPVKVGDRVLYSKYSGTDLKHDGKDLKLIDASLIACVLEPVETEKAHGDFQHFREPASDIPDKAYTTRSA